VDLYKVIVING